MLGVTPDLPVCLQSTFCACLFASKLFELHQNDSGRVRILPAQDTHADDHDSQRPVNVTVRISQQIKLHTSPEDENYVHITKLLGYKK